MTCMITPPSLEMLTRVQRLQDAEKAEVRPKADAIAAEYMEEKAAEVAKADGRDEPTEDDRATVSRAIKGAVLSGAYPIPLHDDGGELEWVPVSTILAVPERYHGRTGPDPIEPDYDDGRQVAKLYLDGTSPCIHSFARGGQTYMLSRGVEWIEVQSGRDAEAAEAAADALSQHPDIFAYAGRVACVRDGTLVALDRPGLQYLLGARLQFYREKPQPKGGTVRVQMNPPRGVVEVMNVPDIVGRLRPADAVISAPTMRPDGSLLMMPGYDDATRLVLDARIEDVKQSVPERPAVVDALAAMDRLLYPFRDFPYTSSVDRAVLLAALLTAVVRPVLPTAPAFGFDAPVQGSGKTLLAKCVGLLANGAVPIVVPHTHGRDDEETRKRLTATLAGDPRCVVWDNVVGIWDSPAMAAMLTSDTLTDRLLGRSETVTFPNRTLWLVTGNNLAPAGDLTRRVLVSRIDPVSERPFARSFDLDPAAHVCEWRQHMVRDILTIMAAYRSAAPATAPGKMASFEDWDAMVRQPIAWLAAMREDLVDPMDAVDARQVLDPEQERLSSLLEGVARVLGYRTFTTRELANAYHLGLQCAEGVVDEDDVESQVLRDLAESLDDFNQRPGSLSHRSIGRILANRLDRIVDGRCLRRVGAARVVSWKVESVGGRA